MQINGSYTERNWMASTHTHTHTHTKHTFRKDEFINAEYARAAFLNNNSNSLSACTCAWIHKHTEKNPIKFNINRKAQNTLIEQPNAIERYNSLFCLLSKKRFKIEKSCITQPVITSSHSPIRDAGPILHRPSKASQFSLSDIGWSTNSSIYKSSPIKIDKSY